MEALHAAARIWTKTVRAELRLVLVAKDEGEPWRRPRQNLATIKERLAADTMEAVEATTDRLFEIMMLTRTWMELTGHTAAATARLRMGIALDLNILASSIHYWAMAGTLELLERAWEMSNAPINAWRKWWNATPPR